VLGGLTIFRMTLGLGCHLLDGFADVGHGNLQKRKPDRRTNEKGRAGVMAPCGLSVGESREGSVRASPVRFVFSNYRRDIREGEWGRCVFAEFSTAAVLYCRL